VGFNLGPEKILVVLVFALIFLGPDKLPEAARKLGEWMGHAKRMSGGFQSELRQALDEPLQTFQREFSRGESRAVTSGSADEASGAPAPESDLPAEPANNLSEVPAPGAAPDALPSGPTPPAPSDTEPDAPAAASPVTHAPTPLPSWVFPGGSSGADGPGFH
jgi:sec-independent protein translocase protein TatB